MRETFSGYVREDGRVGVRDHVLVLPLIASLSQLAARIADGRPGMVAVAHEFEHADDPALAARVFRGVAGSANVGLCLAVADSSLESSMPAALEGVPRVHVLDLAELGSPRRAVERAHALVAREHRPATRRAVPLSHLLLGTECGGSDGWSGITANPALGVASDWLVDRGATVVLAETTELIGAEHLLARRCRSTSVGQRLIEVVGRYEQAAAALGHDIRGAQPAAGNIAGGLTTIEEKSLGAVKKAGSRPVRAVIDCAATVPGGGLAVMDTPGQDIEQLTAMVAGGCQVVAFTTGRGTPTGSPIAPVLKIATNTAVYERMRDDLDLDAGTVLAGEPLQAAGLRIVDAILRVAAGERTSSERRAVSHFAMPSALPATALTGQAD